MTPSSTSRRLLRRLLGVVVAALLVVLALWTLGVALYAGQPAGIVRTALALLYVASAVALALTGRRKRAAGVVVGGFGVALVGFLLLAPSGSRDWTPGEVRMPWAEVEGDRLVVHEVRHARYGPGETADVRWETRTYDLSRLTTVWFLVVPFQSLPVAAHTFVSFGFEGDDYLAVSVEARKERGESYGVLEGLFRRFETIYVAGDERDLVGLRSHVRGDTVYLYPMRSTPEGRRAFLLDMVARMNRLRDEPEFYNALTNSCTTALVTHLDHVRSHAIGWSPEIMLPALSDRLAYAEGLIDTDLPLEAARGRYRVDAARTPIDAPDFSVRIRAP